MTPIERWQDLNAEYLAAAVSWIRLCLEQRAAKHALPSSPTIAVQAEEQKSFWDHFRFRKSTTASSTDFPLLPPVSEITQDAHVSQAAAQITALETQATPPALVTLSQRMGLSRFEKDVLLLCAAAELDTGVLPLCARANGDAAKLYPSFALALSLFENASWDAMSPERPLRYWRLLEINQPGAQPLTTSALRIDERILSYIKGMNYLDDRLSPLLTRLDVADACAELPASQEQKAQEATHKLQNADAAQGIPVIHLTGPDKASKQLVAARTATLLGLRLFRISLEQLPSHAGDLDSLARLWFRESLLIPVALYLDAHQTQGSAAAETQIPLLHRLLAKLNGVIFLDSHEPIAGISTATFVAEIHKPTTSEQKLAWSRELGDSDGVSAGKIAEQFRLDHTSIQSIAQNAKQEEGTSSLSLPDRVWAACVHHTRGQMENLAQRIEPKAKWDDIVLPAHEIKLLRQIAQQVSQRSVVYEHWGFRERANRGLGINALFSGESGTGKTMAAEVIANDLRLDLYRIDLSAVINKYIGETEKNLRRLFDAAEDGGAILFFDEADALFGKRSEVKDSHDRYANIEINYLLQRMESYRGLAILATNMKSALDTAFLRRLRFVVHLPFPGPNERKAIWQKVFPAATPLDALDYERLAKLVVTGGSIRNIALNAAFQAAAAGTAVNMPVLFEAARAEFRKLERPVNEADLRWTPQPQAVADAARGAAA